jgi:hypothetical protein
MKTSRWALMLLMGSVAVAACTVKSVDPDDDDDDDGTGGGTTSSSSSTSTSTSTSSSSTSTSTSTSGDGCDTTDWLGRTCDLVTFDNGGACDTCAQSSCCEPADACMANVDCAGMMNCLNTICADAADPNACANTDCPDCMTQAGIDLYNAWFSDCLGTTCGSVCGS